MNEAEVGRFGSLFSEFLERVVHTARLAPTGAEPVVDRIESFLGSDPLGLPVVSEMFRPFEHATVQLAIDQLLARPNTRYELIGIAGGGREHHSLTDLPIARYRRGRRRDRPTSGVPMPEASHAARLVRLWPTEAG
jgi:hypothetical protein